MCQQRHEYLRMAARFKNGQFSTRITRHASRWHHCNVIRTRFTRFAPCLRVIRSHVRLSTGRARHYQTSSSRLAGMILGISPNCEEPHQYETGDEASDMRSIGDATCLRSSTKYS